ncbi:ankyrin repeat domain-containing protein 16-like [Lingula anatina]|uniref:Ankyrin repeat domain-containing protein 16-like n=1 Tax=Lingula anatina TaxID=7574 RepID=A0A1S3JQZ8_LINAN|nr:ankyrin repeat domain-containing protein 16-like [Lingula anatina]|eukprot:XP_013412399.1 ankyrin repeat domain-containing protein 16-like [Lingula anatina]
MPSPNATDALLKEAQHGHLESVKRCIEHYFPGDDFSWLRAHHAKSGDTLFTLAARHGHVDILNYCLEARVDINQGNFDGKRALHEASHFGQLECVTVLLNNGAAIDALKKADWTPLMLACTKTNLEVIQELIQRGANISLKNKDGWNCFHLAVRVGYASILNYLLDCDELVSNTVSKNGRTPLHTAALHGQQSAVDILLDRGVTPVDQQDSCGTTPLMDALRAGHLHVADMLIAHGANVRKRDILGREAFHLAAEAGCVESVEHLIQKCGVDINTSTHTGNAALHLAAKEGQSTMILCLLQHGCDLSKKDNRGRTALHIASGAQHTECIKILLQHGAADQPDLSGQLACGLVRNSEVAKLFSTTVTGR